MDKEKFLLTEEELATSHLFEQKGSYAKNSRMSLRTTPRFSWALELLKREINYKGSSNSLMETLLWDFLKVASAENINKQLKNKVDFDTHFLPKVDTSLVFLSGMNPFSGMDDCRFQSISEMTWSYFKILRIIKLSIIKPSLLNKEENELLNYICNERFFWEKMPSYEEGEYNLKNCKLKPVSILVSFGEWDTLDDDKINDLRKNKIKKDKVENNGNTNLVDDILKNFFAKQGSKRSVLSDSFEKVQTNKNLLENEQYMKFSKEISNLKRSDFKKFIQNFTKPHMKRNVTEVEDIKFINFEIDMLYSLKEKTILNFND